MLAGFLDRLEPQFSYLSNGERGTTSQGHGEGNETAPGKQLAPCLARRKLPRSVSKFQSSLEPPSHWNRGLRRGSRMEERSQPGLRRGWGLPGGREPPSRGPEERMPKGVASLRDFSGAWNALLWGIVHTRACDLINIQASQKASDHRSPGLWASPATPSSLLLSAQHFFFLF